MKTRFKLEILNVLLGFAALVTPLFAQAPVVSVTVKNLETLGEKLPSMAEDAEDANLGLAMATFQSFISQPSFTEAIDPARPVGLFLIPTESKFPTPVAVVPVKDAEKALQLLPSTKFVTEKTGENSWKISKEIGKAENARTIVICVEQQGDWCFLKHEGTEFSVKDSGQKLVQALTAPMDSDFQITFNVNAVPQKDRQKFVTETTAKIEKDLRGDGEKKLGKEMTDFFLSKLREFAKEAELYNWESPIERATLGYTWDEDARKLVIRNSFTGRKDAHQVQDLSRVTRATTSALDGFGTDGTLASFQMNATIPEMNDSIVKELLAMHHRHGMECFRKCVGEEKTQKVENFFKQNGELFRCAFVGPEQEAAGAVYAERGKKFTFVYARSVPDGYALEKTFQQTVNYIREKKADRYEKYVKNDSRSEREELHIYQADFVPKKELSPDLKELFPETIPGCMIFTPTGVYCALGTDAVETLVKNIQATRTADVPFFAARVSLASMLDVCGKARNASDEQKEKLQKLGDAEATVKVVSREDGVEIVTEIPVQFFQAIKILKKK